MAEVFSAYKKQHELSGYISDFAKNNDVELLIKLNRKRAEEVVHASEAALVRIVKASDEEVLEKMAKSNSRKTILTFEKIALNVAEDLSLNEIRTGLNAKKLWKRLLSIYALANKGNNNDLVNLQTLVNSKTSQKVKTAITKTVVRLAIHLGSSMVLKKYLYAKNKFTVEKALEAIDTPSNVLDIGDLFHLYKKYPFLVSKAIYNISTRHAIPELKRILSKVRLQPPARELVYALCKFGGEEEFSFLFQLFLNYESEIYFWNPFAAVNRISDIATKKHIALLEKVINTKEFWKYYTNRDRPESRIPLRDYSNVYFIKRLAGTAFGKIATRAKFSTIYKMLCHDYWIIQNAALEAIRKYGKTNDIGILLEMAIGNPTESYGLIEAICIIDDKANKIKGVS